MEEARDWGRVLETETVPAEPENPLGRLRSCYLRCRVPARCVCKPVLHPDHIIAVTTLDDDQLGPRRSFGAFLDQYHNLEVGLELYDELLLVLLRGDQDGSRGLVLSKLEDKNTNTEDRHVRIGMWEESKELRESMAYELPSLYDLCRVDDPSAWMEITIV